MKMSKKTKALVCKIDQKLKFNRFGQITERLFADYQIEIGYRLQCGTGKTDETVIEYRLWLKILRSLRNDGFVIIAKSVKHKNSWATNNGGFWNSTIYRLVSTKKVYSLIDAVKKYDQKWWNGLYEWLDRRNLLNWNETFNLRKGDLILFWSGYYGNIRMMGEILGFDVHGYAYILWDGYWGGIKLENTFISKVENPVGRNESIHG